MTPDPDTAKTDAVAERTLREQLAKVLVQNLRQYIALGYNAVGLSYSVADSLIKAVQVLAWAAAHPEIMGELASGVKVATPVSEWQPTHQHYKGGLYQFLYSAHMSEDRNESVIVYRSELGMVWVRPSDMFFGEVDGKRRFEPIISPPAPSGDGQEGG